MKVTLRSSLVSVARFYCALAFPCGPRSSVLGFTRSKMESTLSPPERDDPTCSFVVTQEGVVMIDSLQQPNGCSAKCWRE